MENKNTEVGDETSKNLTIAVIRMEKLKNLFTLKSPQLTQFKLWALGFTAMVLLLWVRVVQLTTQGETLVSGTIKYKSSPSFPPKTDYTSRGYLMVSSNGGLNQMRSGICDMVSIARYLNVTLIVPELDNISFWNDNSQFKDIFDVDYFINSLRDEVRIIKELPFGLKRKYMKHQVYSMPPVSWSNMSYYYNTVLPRIEKYGVVRFSKTDARLANNGLPEEVQRLRCQVNYKALRFIAPIEELGKKIVGILRQKGSFMVLHLRYEMDMIAFSGCTEGCTEEEAEELKKMRYSFQLWKEKEIDSQKKRQAGLCPLTPEEITLALRAFDIDSDMQIYIAAGDIYGGERRLAGLKEFFPNLVKKETLLPDSDLQPFQNHSNLMAALDYAVSLASDIFVMSFHDGHMAKLVEGHRRFLGYKVTKNLDQKVLVTLIDQYRNGTLNWNEFSQAVKDTHANRMGSPTQRLQIPGKPKLEDYFYRNPEECLPQVSGK